MPKRRILIISAAAAPVAVLLFVILLPKLPPIRTALLTAALVPQMLGSGPLSAAADDPSRTTATYGTPADRMDIYVPAGTEPGARLPAVVLELGVHPQPIDDPSVVRLASAISRLGVVVGVPDSAALRSLHVSPTEPGHLVDALLVVANRPEVDPERVGLAGFSAGASIALIAAADPRVADQVRFVSAFGGYADAERLLVDVATGTSLSDGRVIAWQPDPGIRHDILELALATLESEAAKEDLRSRLEPIMSADEPPAGPRSEELAELTGDARQMYLLFTAADRTAAQQAIDSLTPDLRTQLAGISPTAFADGIRAPVFILHGVTDTAIPVAHATLLKDAIGAEVARLTTFGRFGHGQPGQDGLGIDDAGDVWELALYLRDIVAAAVE